MLNVLVLLISVQNVSLLFEQKSPISDIMLFMFFTDIELSK